MVSQDMDDVARLFGSSLDDVSKGLANFKTAGLLSKILEQIAYIGAFIDAGIGIKENIASDSSWQKTVSEAVVDIAVSGGSIMLSIKFGALIGSLVAPGLGTIIGAIAGLILGGFLYYITDVKKVEGKSIRDHIKDYINDAYGWD